MDRLKIEKFSNKRIAILGFGREGRALYDFFTKNDIRNITIFDERPNDDSDRKDAESINLKIHKIEEIDLSSFDIVFRSPGVNPRRLSDLSNITSATNLFFELCPGKIIGITGTKGKSTTSKLVEKLLELNNKDVFIGGNIGVVPLEYLDQLNENSYVILELSSFQLQDLKFSPEIAVILPITSDHLDYHINEQDYVNAKSSICRFQDSNDLVVYYDEGHSSRIASMSNANKVPFLESMLEVGCFISGLDARCVSNSGEKKYTSIVDYAWKNKIPIVDLLAVVALGYSKDLEVNFDKIFFDFHKMPYRIEFIRECFGVKFYNDSAATNPISTIAAIKTFDDPYILISGGSSKNLSYVRMAEEICKDPNLIAIHLTGNTAEEIRIALTNAGYTGKIELFDSLGDALDATKIHFKEIKSVLYSPASASFDNFENYIKRGEYFSNLVNKL